MGDWSVWSWPMNPLDIFLSECILSVYGLRKQHGASRTSSRVSTFISVNG